MASLPQMRDMLKKAYSGPDWALKVDKMPRKQVLDVFNRLVQQKVIKV